MRIKHANCGLSNDGIKRRGSVTCGANPTAILGDRQIYELERKKYASQKEARINDKIHRGAVQKPAETELLTLQ